LPPRCEDFRQTDCGLTQLWKAKAPKEQPGGPGNLSGYDNRARQYEKLFILSDPDFYFIPDSGRLPNEDTPQNPDHHQQSSGQGCAGRVLQG